VIHSVPEKTDVLIIGAGPSGCAAALRACQAGLSVVMLEANRRIKQAPGETLHPGVEPLLQQIGVLEKVLNAGFIRHDGVWVQSCDRQHFSSYGGDFTGKWRGFQVDRQVFHGILLQAAIDAGVTVIRPCRPENVFFENGRLAGVIVNGTPLRAEWTVDSTGRTAWLAKMLALAEHTYSPPLYARFGWRDETAREDDAGPRFRFRTDGWDWMARVNSHRVAWVELRIRQAHEKTGMDLTWRVRPQCAGPGYCLLGDAAAALDPALSHGVIRALMSGILFGYLVDCRYRTGMPERDVITAYCDWIHSQFEFDQRHLRKLYIESIAGPAFSDRNLNA